MKKVYSAARHGLAALLLFVQSAPLSARNYYHSGNWNDDTVVVSADPDGVNSRLVNGVLPASGPQAICPSDMTVCFEAAPFVLPGATPVGGIYTGPGVAQNVFDPAGAGYGSHTITYTVGGNPACTFQIIVQQETPPIVFCDEITQVALGTDCMALVNASTFDDGSYDYCSDVYFKVRRMDVNACQPGDRYYDQVKFCSTDLGQTIYIVLRVYDVPVPAGEVALAFEQANINECVVEVSVTDKIRPTCTAPAHVTVSCENFDPTLLAYGVATGTDNCCMDTVTVTNSYTQFDTLCTQGTITRRFTTVDCVGNTRTCTQRVVVTYNQHYFVKFPNDVLVTACDPNVNYGEPEFFGEDCELFGVSYVDKIIGQIPDACYKIERTWTVINWCAYNPNLGCTVVPNPNPNSNPNHPSNRPGPIVSEAGAQAPWAPTVVAILPGQPPTNFSTFWSANANCYQYTQIIKILDSQDPIVENCPVGPLEICDLTPNDAYLWNEPYWFDNAIGGNDLCEGVSDLSITATDLCSGSDIRIRYLLFLDLDNDGTMETIVNSADLPGFNTVNFDNIQNPNFSGGTPRQFDERPVPTDEKYGFALQTTVSGNNQTAAVRWNTQQAPNTYTVPELPYGTHKIKWFVEDNCGNEKVCEYVFVVKDCKAPTVVCLNGLSVNILPVGIISLHVSDFLQYTEDNCTPGNQLVTAIRKAGAGSGFPLYPYGQPQKDVQFGTGELGVQQVEIWSLDKAGNSDFCLTYVVVCDPNGFSGGQPSYPDLTVCPGENIPGIPLSGPIQGATYSWQNDNPAIGLEVLGMGDIPSFTATNNTPAPLTAVVQVFTHSSVCSSPDTVRFTITVNPAPVVIAPGDVMVCQGENTVPIPFSGSLPGMTFSWTNDNPAIGLAAAGTGNIPAFTAENNTSAPLTAHIEVTGSGMPGLQCPDPVPALFTIMTKPVPMVTDPGDQEVCAGGQSAPVQFSGNLPGTTYTWTTDNPAIGLAAFGSGDIGAFTAVNNTDAPITATITVMPQMGDMEPPTVTCVNGLAANLLPPGMATLFAADFLAYAQDNVTPFDQLTIAIRKAGAGSGFPLDTYGNPQVSVCFDCSEIGAQAVEIWVKDVCGNTGYCSATVTILDGSGVCNNDPGDGFCITGKAVTEYGDGVEDVLVTVIGPGINQSVLTDNGGNYMFCNLPVGQDYEICLVKADNPLNGVNTFDLVLKSKHILGLELLDSPYKIIAADVDLTETVTTIDIEETRKLIVGIYTEFPVAPSWQFVPADHVFPNPADPFSDPFPRGCKTVSLNGDVHNQDFIAIKTADLNGSAVANDRPPAPKPPNAMQMQVVCPGCPGEPVTFTITVHPAQVAGAPGDVLVCAGQNAGPIPFSGSLPGMTFSWTNDNPGIGLAAAGTGNIPAFTAENNTSVQLTAHIEVTGGGISGLQCPDPVPAFFTIVVKPVPMVTDPGDQALCTGGQSAPVLFSGNLPGTTFTWTNDNPAIGLAAFGSGDIGAFTAVNNTGASITATITVTPQVGDMESPEVTCVNGLVASLSPLGMITLFATDFLASVQDNVTPSSQLKIAIRKSGSGTGFPLDTYGNPQVSVCFGCSEIGVQAVEIWVEDACGNANSCQTTMTIQDSYGACSNGSGDSFCITGKAVTEYGDGVEEVLVSVTGPGVSQTIPTDNGGNYMFCDLPTGQDYEICLVKDENPLNGVSAYDLVLMSEYILGVTPLNSPYKIIAADVNLTETVTTGDIEETRDLILFNRLTLTAPSWQFVPADYVFPNPENPFIESFPRGCKTVSLGGDAHDQDFIAVKTADLDGNAVAGSRPPAPKPPNAAQMQVVCPDCPGEPVTFTITIHPPLNFALTPASPSCNGVADGSLTANSVSGGQPPYLYALNGGGFQNNPVFSGLDVGTYTLTVQDADGCTAQQQANLPQGPDKPLVIRCPGTQVLTANSSCQVLLPNYSNLADVTGGCILAPSAVVQTPASGALVNPGTVYVQLTACNPIGQTALCGFNVVVSGGCGG
ncbi:MAG: hypothetical protein IPM98_03960 [Lewinellaceae bacterium]|nr:hypothetical protein [Lewinellaceae bacterium]